VPYFSLHHKSVQFCEYVGVIQVGGTTIEVYRKLIVMKAKPFGGAA